MTEAEVRHLKKIIVVTAEYYGRDLSTEAMQMRASDLAHLLIADVERAYIEYRRNPKNRTDPLPAQIMEILDPSISDDGEATEAAARVIAAVSKHGHTNPIEARQWMGELGWKVVEILGGWYTVCTSLGIGITAGTAQAQWTKIAKQVIDKSRAGKLEQRPALPPSTDPSVLKLARGATKEIE